MSNISRRQAAIQRPRLINYIFSLATKFVMKTASRLLAFALPALLGLAVSALAQDPPPIAAVEDFATVLITKSPQERASLLSSKKDLMTPDLRRALIREGNIHLMAGRYSTAFDIYGLAQ